MRVAPCATTSIAIRNGCVFLRIIDNLTPKGTHAHLIVDNYAIQKHPLVKRWLQRRPVTRGSTWSSFFRDLTENQLRRRIFRSVEELLESIGEYIDHHDREPKPLIWTAKSSDILEKVKRARAALA